MKRLTDLFYPTSARARQAAEDDPTWAVWHYDPTTWRNYDSQTWRRAEVRSLLLLVIGLAWALLIWLLIPAFLPLASAPPEVWLLAQCLPIWGAIATIFGVGLSFMRSWQMHRARLQGAGELRIGPMAIVEPGGAIPLAGPGRWIGRDILSPPMHTLREVQIQPGNPAILSFRGTGGQNWPTEVKVPIPPGQEAAASALVARFEREILQPVAPASAISPQPESDSSASRGLQDTRAQAEPPRRPPPGRWAGGSAESQRYGGSRQSDEDPTAESGRAQDH